MSARRAALGLLVAVLLVAPAACGTDGPDTQPTAEPTATTGPTGEPTTTAEPGGETTETSVYFTNEGMGDPCEEVFAVAREVPADNPVEETVAALVAGPTGEEDAEGYGGWFSEDTADLVRSVAVEDGTATVDFGDLRPVIPNASSSCGSAALLAQLDETLLQFPEVEATRYSIEGSAEDFYEWLQRSVPD